ncbi:MOXD1 homolog 1-like [Oratosquilla oratoria]|uniref:MOXD1 homolog 1-like n=1 Tax=Oratosquilla oratoria TaxID=337810 RepID=UPI003F774536
MFPREPTRLLLLLLLMWDWEGDSEAAPAASGDLAYEEWLDRENMFLMKWTPEKERIIIEIQVATLGWVGLGFSPTGSMEESDMIIAWVDDATGEVTLHDRYAETESTPTIDPSQDYELLEGRQTENNTIIRFTRPWVTCDTQHDLELSGDTQRVIWAFGSDDPEDLMRFSWHNYHSAKSLLLIDPIDSGNDKILEGAKSWEIRSPNVALADDTRDSYICSLHRIPSLDAKHHAIGIVPALEEKNVEFVHHLILTECTDEAELTPYLNKSFECYKNSIIRTVNSCEMAITAWAFGGGGDIYPENVGYPIGDVKYFMLEVHYNNPKLKKNITDSSGVRVLYTDKLREFESGTLVVGESPTPEMIIPPGQVLTTSSQCSASCVEKIIPASGITVFAALLHTHITGTSVTVKIIRDGKELPPLFIDEKYDYNYQQTRRLPVQFTIKPGDAIVVDCKYDATSREKVSYGGFSTQDEMCFAFLYTYPRIESMGCYSRTRLREILSLLNVTQISNAVGKYIMPTDKVAGLYELYYYYSWASEQENINNTSSNEVTEKKDPKWSPEDVYMLRDVKVAEPKELSGKTLSELLEETDWTSNELTSRLEKLPKNNLCILGLWANTTHDYDFKIPEYEPYQKPPRPCVRGLALNDSPASVSLSDQPQDSKEAKKENKLSPSDGKETNSEADKGNTSQIMREDQPVQGERAMTEATTTAEDQLSTGRNSTTEKKKMSSKKDMLMDDESTAEPSSTVEVAAMTEDKAIVDEGKGKAMADTPPDAEPEPKADTKNKNITEDKDMPDKGKEEPSSGKAEDVSDEDEDKVMEEDEPKAEPEPEPEPETPNEDADKDEALPDQSDFEHLTESDYRRKYNQGAPPKQNQKPKVSKESDDSNERTSPNVDPDTSEKAESTDSSASPNKLRRDVDPAPGPNRNLASAVSFPSQLFHLSLLYILARFATFSSFICI